MSLPLVNTMQYGIRGNTAAPVITESGVAGFCRLDSTGLVSGLLATDDEQGDISLAIQPDGEFYAGHLGDFEHPFIVRDKWGNTATYTTTISVIGEYKLSPTPYYDGFDELHDYWTQQSGTFSAVNGSLMGTGDLPSRPWWLATVDGDSNAHVQATFNLNGTAASNVAVVLRYKDNNNHIYATYEANNGFCVVKRENGSFNVALGNTGVEIPANDDFEVGLRAVRDEITLFFNGSPVGSFKDDFNLYESQHGVMLFDNAQEVKEFRIAASDSEVSQLTGTEPFPTEAPNMKPTAFATTSTPTVTPGDSVVLDSSGSIDNDGTIVSRTWTLTTAQQGVTFYDATAAIATASGLTEPGTYTFRVTVTDDDGETSSADVSVTVLAANSRDLVAALELVRCEIVHDENLQIFEGYGNREKIGFRPDNEVGLPIRNGMIDWSDSRWDRVEVIAGIDSKISTNDALYSIDNEWLRLRLGDLKLSNSTTLELTFVAYVKEEPLGFVLTANHQIPLAKASVFRKRFQGQ
ncbi:PKD domain-containing protein [Alteromonas confluentis]|uniref:PKD/Chitinase domain-containing protein n=1 Tax=Alteromonas confluentis TaxID=1656094 RepID=A0A1E7ZEA4_9ALTE|nr:putative Ig domain-containing protein [Alteromonas confluentis]OFC71827.1 hypothetical protein BFC18_06640 [Alteromonas confluentis]